MKVKWCARCRVSVTPATWYRLTGCGALLCAACFWQSEAEAARHLALRCPDPYAKDPNAGRRWSLFRLGRLNKALERKRKAGAP